MTTDTEDCHLMLAYAGGDIDAFEQLYAGHKHSLYHYIRKSCGNEAIAHELYQDVWLRVIRARKSFRQDAPFNAWLYRIARNRLIDHHRQQTAQPDTVVDIDTQASSVSSIVSMPLLPDEIASLSERAQVLNHALQALPTVQREAMLLRHIAGMSVSEVAAVVNEGVETVKSRLRYATARLRSQLKELA